jgi:hypothetical protein
VKFHAFNDATFNHSGQWIGLVQQKENGSVPEKSRGKENKISEWFCP